MSLFHRISFPEIDPLGGGLAEEIAAEQRDEEVIRLEEGIDSTELLSRWSSIEEDVKLDPEWFHMSED